MDNPNAPSHGGPASGVVVSTRPDRGDFHADDFPSDDRAVQHAYDAMVGDPALPRTLILDAPDRPFAFAGPLDIWQSSCRVTSNGGPTLVPAEGYSGALIQSGMRGETEAGEDNLISNVVLDHIWIDGQNRAQGIKLRDLQLSTVHDLHVRRTDGPGLWLSDGCIENLFSNLVLSDECGSETAPALLIEPESATPRPGVGNEVGNLTVNSTHFSGIMIHFPTRDALRIGGGPMSREDCKGHRKIQFTGCFFHAHGRCEKPLVTVADAFQLTFIGTQMLAWKEGGAVLQLGTGGNDALPVGDILVSHCFFASKRNCTTTGIRLVNVATDRPCLSLFGNAFGSQNALHHAVDWGEQAGKRASWAGNTLHLTGEPFLGVPPENADVSPFQDGPA